MKLNRALCATTALATGLLLATSAMAQSTGSSVVEELVVTGSSGPRSLDGFIAQTAPKTKTTIDQDFIAKQMPGQTVMDSLNVVPGYNFTNNDAYGNAGGNVRLRGYECARISFQWDGMQLNDSGNYACFTNQLGDSEIISSAEVSQGTTDVDSPSASAIGGAINYKTKVPDKVFGLHGDVGVGSLNFRRYYGEVDSGEVGPWGTRMFLTGSYTNYDKYRGEGTLKKTQWNGRIFQPLRDNGDFVSLAFNWNKNRNNSFFAATLAQYQQFGYTFDNDFTCTRPTPVAGTAQNDGTQSTVLTFSGQTITGSCTNYFNTRINPSDTGNLRGQFKYHITDNLIFTFDPNFQYVLANGGGFTLVSETDNRLRGAAGVTAPGKDLNGDGDTLDTAMTYSPNNTNTRRYGINSSLIYDLNENNHFRLAYSLDYARHRQTGEYTFDDAHGNPSNVFGGKDGYGPKIFTNDGSFLRTRDRFSIAQLNMVAAEYFGRFMDDKFELRLGLRAPFFTRDLNQYCYSQNGSSTVLCTTQPIATTLPNGNVQFAGNTNQYIKPYAAQKKWDKALPNVGGTWKFADNQSVYISYAEGLSAPRTDNLYTVTRAPDGSLQNPGVNPETTQTIDLGYRLTTPKVQLTLAIYDSKFQNRIASSYDQALGVFTDRNVGDADIRGFDGNIVWAATDAVTYIGTLSYNDSEILDNVPLSGGNFLPTKGKKIVETPEWEAFNRVEWEVTELISLGLQTKYVGKRYSTDVNDQWTKAYNTWDADVRIRLPVWGDHNVYLQANVKNIGDYKYLGSINSQTNAITVPGSTGFAPTYQFGSPRTYQFTLHADF